MIRYRVVCDQSHGFDAWFASSEAFAEQAARGLVACTLCGSTDVRLGLMAPAVRTSRSREALRPEPSGEAERAAVPVQPAAVPADRPTPAAAPPAGRAPEPPPREDPVRMAKLVAMHQAFGEALRKLREHVVANGVDVGRDFPEEARKIHYGEADPRGIYGEATPREAKELLEEGIDVLPVPPLPEDHN